MQLLIRRKRRALAAAVPGAAFLLDRAVEDLGRAACHRRTALRQGGGAVLPHRRGRRRRARERQGDNRSCASKRTRPSSAAKPGLVGSFDQIPLEPESIDLAVSLLSLHEANDIPGALIQIRRALRPDGLFLGAMAGGGTLAELRESLLAAETELHGGASPRVAPFTDVRDAGALLQRAGFALPVADVETVTVRYDSLFGLMRGSARHGRVQRACRRARGGRRSRRLFRAPPRSMPSASPIRTAGSGRPSPSSGCRAGRRTPRSRSRSSPAARGFADRGAEDQVSAGAAQFQLRLDDRSAMPDPTCSAARCRRCRRRRRSTSESTATIRPYSIAVAPLSVCQKSLMIERMSPRPFRDRSQSADR